MGRSGRVGRWLGMLLLIVLVPLFLRIALVRWWLVLPLMATLLICYVARIRKPFTILLVVAAVLVGMGIFF